MCRSMLLPSFVYGNYSETVFIKFNYVLLNDFNGIFSNQRNLLYNKKNLQKNDNFSIYVITFQNHENPSESKIRYI